MGINKSYLYHDLKLTQKFYKALFVVLLVYGTVIILSTFDTSRDSDDISSNLFIMSVICGIIMGSNGLHSSNMESGWNYYSFTLPVRASQKAWTALSIKLIYWVLSLLIIVSVSLAVSYIDENTFCIWRHYEVIPLQVEFDYHMLSIIVMLAGSGLIITAVLLFGAIKELHLSIYLLAAVGITVCAFWGALFGVDKLDYFIISLLTFIISATLAMLWDTLYIFIIPIAADGRNLNFARLLTLIAAIVIIGFISMLLKLFLITLSDPDIFVSFPITVILFCIILFAFSCFLYYCASLRLCQKKKA